MKVISLQGVITIEVSRGVNCHCSLNLHFRGAVGGGASAPTEILGWVRLTLSPRKEKDFFHENANFMNLEGL